MAKFLVTYHSDGMPADPAQAAAARDAFGAWLSKAGNAVVDPGAPVRSVAHVPSNTPLPEGVIGGYSVIEAPTTEAAVEVLKSPPVRLPRRHASGPPGNRGVVIAVGAARLGVRD